MNNLEESDNIKIIKNYFSELLQREPDNLGLSHYLKLLNMCLINLNL